MRYGNSGTFTQNASHSPDFLLGYAFTIPQAFTLTAFGVNVLTAPSGGQGKFALYSDAGGTPGTLLASTQAVVIGAGRQEFPASASTQLSAGTYWLMTNFNVTTAVAHGTASATPRYRSLSFSSALPTSFGTASSYSDTQINTWVVGF